MAEDVYYHTLLARILHWFNAANIGLLTTTGLYIRDPHLFMFFANMDIARKTHFIAMYLLLYGMIIRIYYSYVSRDYKELMFRFKDLKDFPVLTAYYLFLRKELPNFGKYNPGQKMTYTGWVVLVFLQAISGFLLYFPESLGNIARVLGGPIIIRQFHFIITWVFILTVAMHIYLAFIGGWEVVKSMIIGNVPESKQPVSEEIEKLTIEALKKFG